MKKAAIFLIFVILFSALGINCFAKDYMANSDDKETSYDLSQYLPSEILDILNKNGGQALENIDVSFIFKTAMEYIFNALKKHSAAFSEIIALIVVFAILTRIMNNTSIILIINVVYLVCVLAVFFGIFREIHLLTKETLSSISEIFRLVLPTVVTVLLMGGASITSGSAATSFGATVICLESVLSELGLLLVMLSFIFMIFEKISPVFEKINCVKHLKKYSVTLISFVCTVLMTVLSFQSVLSARADSLSSRSLKFAAANFIPIVGGAVGESLKTLGYGIKYLSSSIGGAVSLTIFFTVFPILAELIIIKLSLSFSSFSASILGVNTSKGAIDVFVEIIDIFLVIIIFCLVLSLLVVLLFTNSFIFS